MLECSKCDCGQVCLTSSVIECGRCAAFLAVPNQSEPLGFLTIRFTPRFAGTWTALPHGDGQGRGQGTEARLAHG